MSEFTPSTPRLVRDPGLQLVTVAGNDATAFLHAQSMTPLTDCPEYRCITCAFADNKGRVIAIATAWRRGESWQLLMPAGHGDWLAEHLMRYRFHSRCDIESTADFKVCAVFGKGAGKLVGEADWPVPGIGHAAGDDSLSVVASAHDRYLAVGLELAMPGAIKALEFRCETMESAYWRGACMIAGEVAVYGTTRGRFLPQMLNLDERDVIGWQKGCYPGQEVIARLQHRGEAKKRLLLLEGSLEAGVGKRAEVAGTPVEIVDHGVLGNGQAVTQVVAPHPFDPALERLRLSLQ